MVGVKEGRMEGSQHCLEKGISLQHPGITTLAGRRIGIIGGDKTGTKPARQKGLIIQMVVEDRKFRWGMTPP